MHTRTISLSSAILLVVATAVVGADPIRTVPPSPDGHWCATGPANDARVEALDRWVRARDRQLLHRASKSQPVPKSASSHTDLLVSAFLVAVAQKTSGRVMNLDLIACVSSREEHPAKVEAMLATLSTQPFVRFSLN